MKNEILQQCPTCGGVGEVKMSIEFVATYNTILSMPGKKATAAQLCEKLVGVTMSTMNNRLTKLTSLGLLRRERSQKKFVYEVIK